MPVMTPPAGTLSSPVHLVARQLGELQEGAARVDQGVDALARQHLAAGVVQVDRALSAGLVDHLERRVELRDLGAHLLGVLEEGGRGGVDLAVQHLAAVLRQARHAAASGLPMAQRRAVRLRAAECSLPATGVVVVCPAGGREPARGAPAG